MSVSHLTVIQSPQESRSYRLRVLQDEVRAVAQEQVLEFHEALQHVQRLAQEIATGGDAYPVGVREVCRAFAEQAQAQSNTVEIIMGRAN